MSLRRSKHEWRNLAQDHRQSERDNQLGRALVARGEQLAAGSPFALSAAAQEPDYDDDRSDA